MCCQGTAVYGATHLADLTEEEFKQNYLGFKRSQIERSIGLNQGIRSRGDDPPEIHWPPAEIPDVELPEAFDWREHGAVTDVKNQVASILRIWTRGHIFRTTEG